MDLAATGNERMQYKGKRMAPYHRLKGLLPAVHPKGTPNTKPNKRTNPLIQNGRNY